MDMGKAIILKKKDGEKVYPISASDLIFDPTTKRTVKDDLAGKIGDAPSDGKQYARKNGAWGEVDIPESGIGEAPKDGKQYVRKDGKWVELKDFDVFAMRIDMTKSDPAGIVSILQDNGAIQSIRNNSHRYVGEVINGIMHLRQLDDTDGTRYTDGTIADISTIGKDVWMKLPRFFYKVSKYAENIYDIAFAYESKPDYSFNEWEGDELIGVYSGVKENNLPYSISGKNPSTGETFNGVKAGNRGEGFSQCKWRHRCIMALLFYAYYCNTNCQLICGRGKGESYTNGLSDLLGMTDSNAEHGFVNFWGLENWWGGLSYYLDGVRIFGQTLNIYDDKGDLLRTLKRVQGSGYISKLEINNYLDLIPSELSASATTGFCDYFASSTSKNNYVILSYGTNDQYEGLLSESSDDDGSITGASSRQGFRLSYKGEFIIEE